jgi:hypothetical protein
MLCLNQLLMLSASLAALPVLRRVSAPLAVLSLALNLLRRHRDCSNLGIVLAAGAAAASPAVRALFSRV